MASLARIIALATATPPIRLGQEEIATRLDRLFPGLPAAERERLRPVFANAGVAARHSCVPIEWYERPHGWAEKNRLYLEHALALAEEASRACLTRAGLGPEAVDAVVAVSTTGIATPSLDARLIDRLGLWPEVARLPVFGFGCAGGVLGLARAVDLARARPGTRVLLAVVELCALTFRCGDVSKANVVAAALFGDGAAAALVSTEGPGPAVTATGEHTWPDSLSVMGWSVADDGLGVVFAPDIPERLQAGLAPATEAFLAREGRRLADVSHFLFHPGGARVLTAIEDAFGLAPAALKHSREVLRDRGNMSAPTALFVLERALAEGLAGPALLAAVGPGFSAGFALIEP